MTEFTVLIYALDKKASTFDTGNSQDTLSCPKILD